MSEETLLSAARRAVRFFNIDITKGGIIVEETEQAFSTLEIQIDRSNKTPLRDATRAALTAYSADMNNGGLIKTEAQRRMQVMDREVRQESVHQ